MSEPRYRCDGCGNLTRFDVTTSRTTKAFHHYTVGGALEVEDTTVLSHHVDEVVCRWCGHGRSIVELGDGETGATGATGTDGEREESGAQSRIS
jgi:ribosomal protein S27E